MTIDQFRIAISAAAGWLSVPMITGGKVAGKAEPW
jgi:hypothetical protein